MDALPTRIRFNDDEPAIPARIDRDPTGAPIAVWLDQDGRLELLRQTVADQPWSLRAVVGEVETLEVARALLELPVEVGPAGDDRIDVLVIIGEPTEVDEADLRVDLATISREES